MNANKPDLKSSPGPETNSAPKTICIVQMTRIGDVLQTLQAAQMLKLQHPGVRLILVARQQFAEPLEFILDKTFDRCFYINLKTLMPDKNTSIETAQQAVKNFTGSLKLEHIQVTVNLSFSKSSAYLTSLIPSTHKLGLYYDNLNNLKITDKWSQFIYSNVMGGPLNPFSLIDIYKCMLGVSDIPEINQQQKKKTNTIVIHPFASIAKKCWKANKWSEVLYQLLKNLNKITITIVGTKKEGEDIVKILNSPLLSRYSERINNLCGKTSIKDLFSIMDSADLFVGHDSMVGHIASLTNTKSITISLGTVRPHETTPYGRDNFNITPTTKCFPCFPDDNCDYHQCHSDIPYQVVYTAVRQFILEGTITKSYLEENNSCFLLNSVNVFASKLTSSGHFQLHEILEHNKTTNGIFILFYRICWQYLFNSIEEPQSFPALSNNTHQQMLHYINGLQYLFELCNFGQKYSRYILEEVSSKIPRLEKIKEYSNKIDEIDELQKLIKHTYPHLSPIIDYLTVQKGNLNGINIIELAEGSFTLYNEASNLISIIHELLEKTVAEHKIKNKISSINNEFNSNR